MQKAVGRLRYKLALLLTFTTLAITSASTCLAQSSPSAAAETYPNHTIKIIVPFAAGAALDLMTRAVAQELAIEIKQPVVVENKA